MSRTTTATTAEPDDDDPIGHLLELTASLASRIDSHVERLRELPLTPYQASVLRRADEALGHGVWHLSRLLVELASEPASAAAAPASATAHP